MKTVKSNQDSQSNRSCYICQVPKVEICLRKFPYPYKAALAICSDIDSTTTVEEFLNIQKFLNTKNMTEMGAGVGLEIGNSFFIFDDPQTDHFSYFSNNPMDRIVIRKFIKAGYIDCLHSFGDGYKNRSYARTAIKELDKYNLKIKVWVNHSRSKSNLGSWFSTNLGDNIDSKYYHSDITIPYGIKFVWLGSCTCIIGQNVPITLNTFTHSFDTKYALKSARNLVKMFVKHLLSSFSLYKSKYAMHNTNDLVKTVDLDDGRKVYEFMRYDIHPDGIGRGATSRGIAYNISKRVLDSLIDINGYAILYTHFGKNSDCSNVIAEETQDALRYLENQYRNGQIYVTTTSKLLDYYINSKHLRWSSKIIEGEVNISIHSVEDPVFGTFIPTAKDLQGITFYVPNRNKTRIFLGDQEIKKIYKNPADETDRESICIPFTFLKYPD